jgi:hypothetical protein
MSWHAIWNKKMCRGAASKLFLCYFHIMYTDISKNNMLFSTFSVKTLEKNKKITKNTKNKLLYGSLQKTSILIHKIFTIIEFVKKNNSKYLG